MAPRTKNPPSSLLPHHQSIHLFLTTILLLIMFHNSSIIPTDATRCRVSCGTIPINYPFGIDDGCGSPYYRRILACSATGLLELRTPSGRYPVRSISYSDPHIVVTDPYMWNCLDGDNFRATRPFSLDTSTRFALSSQNDYLFFNCSPERVIIEPRTIFCERFPDKCDSTCDSSSYLCRHLPGCPNSLGSGSSCCSYYPKATESLRLMLRYCASYTSIYWRINNGGGASAVPYDDQVPEYGIRIDFDIPVTVRCLRCQDMNNGGGTCGFDTKSQDFLCLCGDRNSTTDCNDRTSTRHSNRGVITGTITGVSAAGAVGVGAGLWFWKKVRAKAPVTCGVQNTENRLF